MVSSGGRHLSFKRQTPADNKPEEPLKNIEIIKGRSVCLMKITEAPNDKARPGISVQGFCSMEYKEKFMQKPEISGIHWQSRSYGDTYPLFDLHKYAFAIFSCILRDTDCRFTNILHIFVCCSGCIRLQWSRLIANNPEILK